MNDYTKGNKKPAFFRNPVHCVKIANDGKSMSVTAEMIASRYLIRTIPRSASHATIRAASLANAVS